MNSFKRINKIEITSNPSRGYLVVIIYDDGKSKAVIQVRELKDLYYELEEAVDIIENELN